MQIMGSHTRSTPASASLATHKMFVLFEPDALFKPGSAISVGAFIGGCCAIVCVAVVVLACLLPSAAGNADTSVEISGADNAPTLGVVQTLVARVA